MILIFTLACTAGCSSIRFPGVFRIDIPQGNLMTPENVAKLELGMTTRQVEYVMGTPMIQDPFTPGRWDYLYRLETGKGKVLRNHLILTFDNDTLVNIDKTHYRDDRSMADAVEERMQKAGSLERPGRALPTEDDAIPGR